MSASQIIRARQRMEDGVSMTHLSALYAQGDALAHTVRVELTDGGQPAQLSGCGVSGAFIRADQSTAPLIGAVSGSVASVTLPSVCYAVPGSFSLILRLTRGEERRAIFWGQGSVARSSTDVYVDGGEIVPSLDDLLARIAEMEAATDAANEAAQQANAGESARESAEAARASAETQRQTDAAAAIAAAVAAAQSAQTVADAVQEKLDGGDFVGAPGPRGETGETGPAGETGPKGDPGANVVSARLVKGDGTQEAPVVYITTIELEEVDA